MAILRKTTFRFFDFAVTQKRIIENTSNFHQMFILRLSKILTIFKLLIDN